MKDFTTHFASVIWCDFWAKQDIQQERNVGRDFYLWDLTGSWKEGMKNRARQLDWVGFEKRAWWNHLKSKGASKVEHQCLMHNRSGRSFLASCWLLIQTFTPASWTPAKLSLKIFKYSYSNSVILREAYIIIITRAVSPNNGIFCKVFGSTADNLKKVENSTILSIGSFIFQ